MRMHDILRSTTLKKTPSPVTASGPFSVHRIRNMSEIVFQESKSTADPPQAEAATMIRPRKIDGWLKYRFSACVLSDVLCTFVSCKAAPILLGSPAKSSSHCIIYKMTRSAFPPILST